MYAALVSDASSDALLMVLIAWIFTLAAVVAVVLFVARWAFIKAESKDVPQVLTGLAHLLRAASWPKDLGVLLGRGPTAEAAPQPALSDAGQLAVPSAGQLAVDALPAEDADGGHTEDGDQAGGGQ